MIVAKKKRVVLAEREIAAQRKMTAAHEGGGWWARMKAMGGSMTNLGTHENVPQLRQDIQALEELSRHLFMEAHDLQNMRERNEWSQTFQVCFYCPFCNV